MAESLMSKEEKKEVAERAKLWNKFEKHGALMVGIGIKVVGGEEIVRIGQSELRRIEEDREQRRREWMAKRGFAAPAGPVVPGAPPPPPAMVFEVNVVGVRVVSEKGRVRSKSHEVGATIHNGGPSSCPGIPDSNQAIRRARRPCQQAIW
jgi:hypothetical protein